MYICSTSTYSNGGNIIFINLTCSDLTQVGEMQSNPRRAENMFAIFFVVFMRRLSPFLGRQDVVQKGLRAACTKNDSFIGIVHACMDSLVRTQNWAAATIAIAPVSV